MKGIQFVVDEGGRKTGVVIDLRRNRAVWEDLFDRAVARRRQGEPREGIERVKRRLTKAGKLRPSASR